MMLNLPKNMVHFPIYLSPLSNILKIYTFLFILFCYCYNGGPNYSTAYYFKLVTPNFYRLLLK